MRSVQIATVILILLADVLLLPSVLDLIPYLRTLNLQGWIENLNLIESMKTLIDDEKRSIWLMFQPIVLLLCTLVFWRDQPRKKNRIKEGVGGPEAVGSGEYGTTRWMTEKEMNEKTTIWKFGEPIQKGGMIVGVKLDKKYAWIIDQDLHTLIIGTTRSGKSRRLVLPTIWHLAHAGESMILTDPKGELYDKTNRYLKEKGYRIVCLDFREPGRGNRWNPLYPVVEALKAGKISEAVQQAFSIAHMHVHQTADSKKGDQVWNNGAESVIAALILAVAMEAPDDRQKHLTSVYKMLGELGEIRKIMAGGALVDHVPLNEYMRELPQNHPARDAFVAARLAPERMRGSFYAQVAALLRLYADPSIAYLTGMQDHDLEGIGKEKTAVFLIIPDEDTTRHPLAALYVEQTYQALVRLASRSKGRIPVRVNMILDEFGNMPPFKDFPTKLTISGGRGVRWHLIVQDFQQLEALYGPAAETIKGNCHVWIYLLTSNYKTAEEISRKLGEYTIETDSRSVSTGKSTVHSQSSGLTGRRLLKPDELERFPENEAVILRVRHFPARVPMPDLSLWPANQEFEKGGGEEEERRIEEVPVFIPGVESDETKSNEDFVYLTKEDGDHVSSLNSDA